MPAEPPLTRRLSPLLLGRCGIKETDTVILYGDNNNWFAAYAYWILKMYGHELLCLMDGGRKKWVLENRPMTLRRTAASISAHERASFS